MIATLYAGADVREDPVKPDPSWDAERRERYLLRRDVARPLSVDRMVWRPHAGPDQGFVADTLPWIAVSEVCKAVASWPTEPAWAIVAIGVVAANASDAAVLKEKAGVDTELWVEPGWTFLGYDVADGGDCSGLCNCGYRDEDEAIVPRAVWAPLLNKDGLFTSVEAALALRNLTNRRVPEHAPFFVKGMWIVA